MEIISRRAAKIAGGRGVKLKLTMHKTQKRNLTRHSCMLLAGITINLLILSKNQVIISKDSV